MAILATSLKPYSTIACDCVVLVFDSVISTHVEGSGLEDVSSRLEHILMCITLITCRDHDQVKACVGEADAAIDCVPQLQTDLTILLLLMASNRPSSDDFESPLIFVWLVEPLVIHELIQSVK